MLTPKNYPPTKQANPAPESLPSNSRLCSQSLRLLRTLIHRTQIPLGRSHDTNTILTKPTAMHGTIPTLLRPIPTHHALQMRTQRREPVRPAVVVLVDGRRLAGLGGLISFLSR